MGNKTPLYHQHLQAGATLVDFAGWDMPLHYGSQLNEHHHVRQDAGMFDVSHMGVVDIEGSQARDYLRYMLANDVAKLNQIGKALYSCMLNEQGGVVDDLIVYYLADNRYRLVVNAGTRTKDVAWLKQHAKAFDVRIHERPEFSIIAIQGPQARAKAASALSLEQQDAIKDLIVFQGVEVNDWFIARTGYTGEDGFEILVPAAEAANFWQRLLEAGVAPCGLAARDTLRLEAGMNLYGADMDENTSPLEANLAWTIAWEPTDRNFIGRSSLTAQHDRGVAYRLVGLVLESKGVLRNHQKIMIDGESKGEITSGSFSPTLSKAIALARVPLDIGDHCQVDMRGKLIPAKVVKPQFVRRGKVLV